MILEPIKTSFKHSKQSNWIGSFGIGQQLCQNRRCPALTVHGVGLAHPWSHHSMLTSWRHTTFSLRAPSHPLQRGRHLAAATPWHRQQRPPRNTSSIANRLIPHATGDKAAPHAARATLPERLRRTAPAPQDPRSPTPSSPSSSRSTSTTPSGNLIFYGLGNLQSWKPDEDDAEESLSPGLSKRVPSGPRRHARAASRSGWEACLSAADRSLENDRQAGRVQGLGFGGVQGS